MPDAKPPKVTLALDEESNFDALYINGELVLGLGETLYACDVLEMLSQKGIITHDVITVELEDGGEWPKKEKDLRVNP